MNRRILFITLFMSILSASIFGMSASQCCNEQTQLCVYCCCSADCRSQCTQDIISCARETQQSCPTIREAYQEDGCGEACFVGCMYYPLNSLVLHIEHAQKKAAIARKIIHSKSMQ